MNTDKKKKNKKRAISIIYFFAARWWLNSFYIYEMHGFYSVMMREGEIEIFN